MVRSLSILLALLVLPACASLPSVSQFCPTRSTAPMTLEADTDGRRIRAGCGSPTAESRLAAVGSVQQSGGRTRRVGGPNGFLVAMIILIVLVSLA